MCAIRQAYCTTVVLCNRLIAQKPLLGDTSGMFEVHEFLILMLLFLNYFKVNSSWHMSKIIIVLFKIGPSTQKETCQICAKLILSVCWYCMSVLFCFLAAWIGAKQLISLGLQELSFPGMGLSITRRSWCPCRPSPPRRGHQCQQVDRPDLGSQLLET